LGKLYMSLEDPAAAYKEIKKAQDLGLRNPEVTRMILEASTRKGDFDGTLARLKALRETADGALADEPDMLTLEGTAQLALGNLDAAEAAYRQALEQSPEDVEALLGIARLSAANNDIDSTEKAVDEVLAIAPDNAEALAMKGGVLARQRDFTTALDYLQRAVAADPEHLGARTEAARLLLGEDRLEEAEESIAALEQLIPGSTLALFLRGKLAYQQRNWRQASSAMTEVLLAKPGEIEALLIIGHSLYMQKNYLEALPHLEDFHALVPRYPPAIKLLAATYVKRGRGSDALALLTPFPEGAEEDPELAALIGSVLIAENQKAEGQKWLDIAAALSPESESIRTRQALGQILLGDTAAATAQLEELSAASDAFNAADFLIIASLLDQRDFDAAVRQCQLLMQRKPDSPALYNMLASALYGKGDLDAAREAFDKALGIDPDFMPALLNLANISLAQERLDEAEQLLRRALAADQRNAQAYVMLARVAVRRNDTATAVDLLEQAANSIKTAVQPRVLLARHYLTTDNVEVALRYAQEAAELAPQQPSPQLVLARAQAATGELAAARATLERLAERYPTVSDVPLFQAELAIAAGDPEAARTFAGRALELAPTNPRALAIESRLAAARGDFEAARTTAQRIKDLEDGVVFGDILLGDIAIAAGDAAAALAAYGAAQGALPESSTLVKLSAAHRLAGDVPAARALLDEWLERYPKDLLVANARADIDLQTGETGRAVEHYENVLQQDPGNILALNNLAYLYLDSDKQKAETYAARAYELAPGLYQVADTYGWVLIRQGKIGQGLQLLEEARRQAPDEPDIRYHYAAGLAKNGDYQAALTELSALLETEKEFGEREAAKRLMTSLNAR
ncbi:MAG: PEP-CTERM system TPR-repeat protein PrsT, partial [Gammaproteobacteria bacterium]|nr:PEP-CTERM system TPR-repeat protein PrsT [Gammaproteobacteria bacterium]